MKAMNKTLRAGLLLLGLGGLAAAGVWWLHHGAGEANGPAHSHAPAHAGHEPAGGPPHADAHEHGAGAAGLTLDDAGRKWATDEALRTGMQAIRAQVIALPEPAAPEQRRQLAAGIRDQVNYLISHCKLEPRADAVLHVLIGQLLAGADALEAAGPETGTGAGAVHALHRALDDYARYFDHPGWPAAAPH